MEDTYHLYDQDNQEVNIKVSGTTKGNAFSFDAEQRMSINVDKAIFFLPVNENLNFLSNYLYPVQVKNTRNEGQKNKRIKRKLYKILRKK